ncbi:CapA family protein [Clostridiisalibacter paucivorans]|uniref:CapA family protein n=1 Tax=Clostridiisalibacter paucivorans TaxID=408753 RepID=UPI000688E278|nr:CapA family protein [Clostridiisalibacter paucivorans]
MRRRKTGFSVALFIVMLIAVLGIYFFNEISNGPIIEPNILKKAESDTQKEETKEPVEEVTNIEATLVATGDIMFHSTQIKGAYNEEQDKYVFDNVFKSVKKYIESADLALGNFETVTAGPEHGYRGFPTFNSPESTLEALGNTGFDILTTANNHSLDGGKEGIIETIDNINKYGMENVGTYKEKTDDILIKDINGIKIAILSYTYGCNGLEARLTKDELDAMVNRIDEDRIMNDINKANEQDVDSTVVFIHWGNEYQRTPSQYQTDLAQKMFDWGADIILGSHPHVIQKSEKIDHNGEDKFVIYSMGNFVSNQRRETLTNSSKVYTEDGVIVQITLDKDLKAGKTKIKEVSYVPTWVHRYRAEGKYKYEILPVEEYINSEETTLAKEVINKMEGSYKNTISLMDTEKKEEDDQE